MGWLGKVVGGTIGFALGGPIGAVAGAAFGHTFDKREDQYLTGDTLTGQGRLSSGEQAQMTFFVAAFSMLAKLTKADGRVTDQEIESIETFMSRDLNLDAASRKSAVDIFRQALHSPEPFDAFALQFYRVFHQQPRIIELMMDVLFRVSVADGDITANEEALIKSAAGIFRMSDVAYERMRSKYVKTVNRAYAVLQCDPGDSNETVKKQYRRLVSEYHPDKIASKGLPEEFITLAGDKFKEIQEAWESIKKERGIS